MIDEPYAGSLSEYVASAEEYVEAFALSKEVHDLLLHPEDPVLLEKAQKYTEDFAAVKGIFEGLYIATPETYVLTHTSQGAIGITTRKDDVFQIFVNDQLLAAVFIPVGICSGLGIPAGLDPLNDFQITGVCGLRSCPSGS